MDFANDDVCVHNVLFNIDKRGTEREDRPVEGIAIRRSDLAIIFLFMYRKAVDYVEKGGKGRAH